MDKHITVGQAILNNSKELMDEFYHDYPKPKDNDKVKLLYVERDSFFSTYRNE